jgi:DNA-binding transcriptional regulator YiaG
MVRAQPESFCDLLHAYRHHVGLEEAELAKQLAVHRNTISHWEHQYNFTRKRPRSPELAQLLIQVLGLDAEESMRLLSAGHWTALEITDLLCEAGWEASPSPSHAALRLLPPRLRGFVG